MNDRNAMDAINAMNSATDTAIASNQPPHSEPLPSKPLPSKPPEPVQSAEPVYSAAQLADNHKAFGTSRAIVATALRLAHKDRASLAEAATIIHTFRQQEVN